MHPMMASRNHHLNNLGVDMKENKHHLLYHHHYENATTNGSSNHISNSNNHNTNSSSNNSVIGGGGGGGSGGEGGSGGPNTNNSNSAARRDHNIDYSSLFVQLTGHFPTLYRCVSCHKTVSNRWHHANIHRPQSHECPVCGQKFTRRDNMKAHCKVKHVDMKDRYYSHYVHM